MDRGYRPNDDFNLSIWLKDQIERSGMEKEIRMLEPSENYEMLLKRCDLFLMTSRLDPLPNVAIDALINEKPVLCFERSTGIAELLESDKMLKGKLVSPYLDTTIMAQQAAELLEDKAKREAISTQCRLKGKQWFNMRSYVEKLEFIGQIVAQEEIKLSREKEYLVSQNINVNTIRLKGESKEKVINDYINSWQTGVNKRKPMPGFHPGIYKEKNQEIQSHIDPFVDYLRTGRPTGPWKYPLITPETEIIDTSNTKLALHIHVHYVEILQEIIDALKANIIKPDIFISYNKPELKQKIFEICKTDGLHLEEMIETPNLGRDIGPFLSSVGVYIDKNYEIYGHLHTKKSMHLDRNQSKAWREFLMGNLLGRTRQKDQMGDRIVSKLIENPNIGMVFPDDPHCAGWDNNYNIARHLAAEMNITKLDVNFNFPIGTMFWARRGSLRPLLELDLSWEDYPVEPLDNDGTILHAIERLMPYVTEKQGFINYLTNVEGLSR